MAFDCAGPSTLAGIAEALGRVEIVWGEDDRRVDAG
jgi:hypothetical protein